MESGPSQLARGDFEIAPGDDLVSRAWSFDNGRAGTNAQSLRGMSRLAELLASDPIAISGAGAVSVAGLGVDALCQRVWAGVASPDTRKSTEFVGCAVNIALPELTAPLRRCDRVVHLAALAAREALQNAGLGPGICTGLAVGTSRGPVDSIVRSALRSDRACATDTVATSLSSVSGGLAQSLGLDGPSTTISTACTSAAQAIAWAAEQILLGKAGAMLAGGVDCPLHPTTLGQLAAAGILAPSPDACRPFTQLRRGLTPGEAAGFLVLEPLEACRRRGGNPLALLAGWASLVEPTGRSGVSRLGLGLSRCVEKAMQEARVGPEELCHVNTHGTGTRQNDLSEAKALRAAMRDRPFIPSAVKPSTGHCMGASPALEAIICCHGLRNHVIPGSPRSCPPDPACGLDFPAEDLRKAHPVALSTSSGFWGHHAALVFRSVETDFFSPSRR